MNDDKQRVLDATDIVRLVEEHLALKRKGREFVGLCPFHDDHNASMTVVPTKQIFKCFSCGAGGDALTFVMDYHGMTFPEALRFLAERSGIELTPWRPEGGAGRARHGDDDANDAYRHAPTFDKASLVGANQSAAGFFRTILRHEEHGRSARELIERRALTPEIVERFGIGAAPDRWDGLLKTIENKKSDPGPFLGAGLLKTRETGGLYDAFRNRLMFPIADQLGRVVAFGARRIDDADEPKYLNSAESPAFNKSKTLYALAQATEAIRKRGFAIVTEGYMDAIACHQAGVENAVATLGTALTVDGARVLQRLCDRIVLLFDADEAGQRAADRALEVLFAFPVDVRIVTPDPALGAKDPDDLLRMEGGREIFDRMIDQAVDALEFRFRRLAAQIAASPSARQRLIDETVDRFCELGFMSMAPHRRTFIQRRLSGLAGSFEHELADAFRRRQGRTRRGPTPQDHEAGQHDAGRTRGWVARDRALGLLGCVLHDPAVLDQARPEDARRIEPARMTPGSSAELIALAIQSVRARAGSPGLREVLGALDDEPARRLAVDLEREVDRLIGAAGTEGLLAQWDEWARILARGVAGREPAGERTDAGTPDGPTGSEPGGALADQASLQSESRPERTGDAGALSLGELVAARKRAEESAGMDRGRVPRIISG